MMFRRGLITAGILLGLMGLVSCKSNAKNETVYRYKETAVYDDDFKISKTVYTAGEMKLYYSGAEFDDNRISCYGADFSELGDEFEHSFKDGVLTVKADFTEQISGLMIDDADNGIIYHLRYLDSSQFAWLAEVLWLDDGWQEVGDAESYYSAEELKKQEEDKEAEQKETADTFELLEGMWISEDSSEKLTFTADASGESLTVEFAWYDGEQQRWESVFMSVEAAYRSDWYDDEAENDVSVITLVNGNHSAAGMELTYDSAKLSIEYGGTLYHRDNSSVNVSSELSASASAAASANVIFDAAYLGYVGGLFDEGFDKGLPEWLRDNNEALLDKYPYIAEIDREHIIGGAGHLYLVAPTDRNATIAINRVGWSEEKSGYEPTEVLYRSESGEPVLLFANLDGTAYEPDTAVFITDNSGHTCEWYPSLDAMSYLVPCTAEDGTSLSRDITIYRHGAAAEYAEWLEDGWLGPTAQGLSGSEGTSLTWHIEDTAWETDRKADFTLKLYPSDGEEGRADLDWHYDGETDSEEEWSGFWSLETENDSPSQLTLSLSRVGGRSLDTADGPMYISGTYPVMIDKSGEKLLFFKDEDQACLPFMAQNTRMCMLYTEF